MRRVSGRTMITALERKEPVDRLDRFWIARRDPQLASAREFLFVTDPRTLGAHYLRTRHRGAIVDEARDLEVSLGECLRDMP